MVRMQLFADHTLFVKTALGAKPVGEFYSAAMGAGGLGGKRSFPVCPAAHLTGVALAFLRNWHGDEYLEFGHV